MNLIKRHSLKIVAVLLVLWLVLGYFFLASQEKHRENRQELAGNFLSVAYQMYRVMELEEFDSDATSCAANLKLILQGNNLFDYYYSECRTDLIDLTAFLLPTFRDLYNVLARNDPESLPQAKEALRKLLPFWESLVYDEEGQRFPRTPEGVRAACRSFGQYSFDHGQELLDLRDLARNLRSSTG